MITTGQANSVAQTQWGKIHKYYKTNRKGAYFFDCSRHGGYIIDGRCLSLDETNNLLKYLEPEYATEAYNFPEGKVVGFRGPFSRMKLGYYCLTQRTRQIPIFYGEEDCAWSVIEKFTDIRTAAQTDPEQTFWNWYDLTNPVVQERHRRDVTQAKTFQSGAYS